MAIVVVVGSSSWAVGQSEPAPSPAPPTTEEETEKENEDPPSAEEEPQGEGDVQEDEPEKPAKPPAESGDDLSADLEAAEEAEAPAEREAVPPAKPPAESGDDLDADLAEAERPPPPEPPEAPAVPADEVEEAEPAPEVPADVIEPVEPDVVGPEPKPDVVGPAEPTKEPIVGVFPNGPFAEIHRLWRPFRDELREETGISIGLAYTTLLQVATSGEDRAAMVGDVDLFGKWSPPDQGKVDAGSLGFYAEQRHRMATSITPNALSEQFGSLWRTTSGFDTRSLSIVQIWWEQYLFDDHVRITAGKIDPGNYYNGNRFQSQNVFFLNQAFSSNPTRLFPRNSIGANLRMVPADDVYVSLGVHDTNGSATTTGLGGLDKDELFYAAEIGFTPEIEGLGRGRYRFTYFNTGAGDSSNGESGYGFALSFDQEIGHDVAPFFRYGYQDRELRKTKQVVAGGLGFMKPFGRDRDVLGIGVAWGEPEDSSRRDQYVAEAFYRLQLTPKIQVTPGYQLIFEPAEHEDTNLVGVFELRLRFLF